MVVYRCQPSEGLIPPRARLADVAAGRERESCAAVYSVVSTTVSGRALVELENTYSQTLGNILGPFPILDPSIPQAYRQFDVASYGKQYILLYCCYFSRYVVW